MDNDITPKVSMGMTIAIQIILITIKLCGVVNWSWWIIFIPAELTIGLTLMVFIIIGIILLVEMIRAKM